MNLLLQTDPLHGFVMPLLYMGPHVLPQGAGVRVALITVLVFAKVGFVVHMYMHVFLAVRAVGETSITATKFTLEWFFTYDEIQHQKYVSLTRQGSLMHFNRKSNRKSF